MEDDTTPYRTCIVKEAVMNVFRKILGYARGFLLKRKITTRGYIQSIGNTIVVNNRGNIIIGHRTCLWPDIKFALVARPDHEKPMIRVG